MDSQAPEFTVEELLQRIRNEVQQNTASQRAGTAPVSPDDRLTGIRLQLPRLEKTYTEPDHGPPLHVKDFLQYHDRQFISMAYQYILKRPPDEWAFRHFLHNLQKGRFTRVEIIGRLRFSPEGRSRKTPVKGLTGPLVLALAGKLPVFGYLLRWVSAWARLPKLAAQLEQVEARMKQKEQDLARRMDQRAALLEAAAADAVSSKAFSPLWAQMTNRVDRLAADIPEQINQVLTAAESAAVNDIRRMVLDQQRRLTLLLEEAQKRLPRPLSENQIQQMVSEEDHLLDAMYASFEDRFRGTRTDIKHRQQIYLPFIEQAGAGEETAPVLDLGCGRGEWLELLKENNKTALGVDINRVFVTQCRDLGLRVAEQDMLAYLRDLDTGSMGAVSAFQLIEHLPLKTLIKVMDETMRVLKPGGIVIFETPNPENILVGSCHFYIDPTHNNPLPPQTAQYLLEARGFRQCSIVRLHPCDDTIKPEDIAAKAPTSLVQLLYGEQDYAVIGHKTAQKQV
ncbi:MAG: class I SAM-dependent methyltransferase [Desulfotignum sp.]|jgi:O-antigen chain-terminating methyltransferase|nr:class I SAM-dependent methyltransferase [Desulfotignum sp.]